MNSPLVVRLPNHLGDACMSLPALDLLAERGFELTLVGRVWAPELFAGYPWPTVRLLHDRLQRISALRREFRAGTRALLLPNSFSSALDFRLARLRASGYGTDSRRLLLAEPIKVPERWRRSDGEPMHMVEYYYELARTVIGGEAPPPPRRLSLRLHPAAVVRSRQALDRAGIGQEFVLLCPVAIGRHRGKVKAWDGFSALCADLLAQGAQVVACPGPGEREAVERAVPRAVLLPDTDLGTFAAHLAASRLVVANDSGAAHLAAAVRARQVTIFGVTDARRTGPWSTQSIGVGSENGWPSFDEVAAAVYRQLSLP
jgi:heptosyltransferase-2